MVQWRKKNLFYIALLISLLLHLGTGLKLAFVKPEDRRQESIEVAIIDQSQKKQENQAKQIVEQSEQRVNDEIDEKAKYLSRYNQRVADETKATNVGKFQNEAKQGPAPQAEKNKLTQNQEQKQIEQPAEKTAKPLTSDGTLPRLASLKPQFHWDQVKVGVQNPGPLSQTDDHLADVKTGAQTLLSSREFVYYSYYSRIKERLRMFWEPKIKEKISRLIMSGRHLASNEEKITKLVITLDRNGKLIRVQVLGPSGVQDLDEAAIEAFQQAAPFPNPPNGIVEADGTIKIRWDFILEANGADYFPVTTYFAQGESGSL